MVSVPLLPKKGHHYCGCITISLSFNLYQIRAFVTCDQASLTGVVMKDIVQVCRVLMTLTNNEDIFLYPEDRNTVFIWSSNSYITDRLNALENELQSKAGCTLSLGQLSYSTVEEINQTNLGKALFLHVGYVFSENGWIYLGDWLSAVSSYPEFMFIDCRCLSVSCEKHFSALSMRLNGVNVDTSSFTDEDQHIKAYLFIQATLAKMHIARLPEANSDLLPCPVICLPKLSKGIALKFLKIDSLYSFLGPEADLSEYWKFQHGYTLPDCLDMVQVALNSKEFIYPISVLWKQEWVQLPFYMPHVKVTLDRIISLGQKFFNDISFHLVEDDKISSEFVHLNCLQKKDSPKSNKRIATGKRVRR